MGSQIDFGLKVCSNITAKSFVQLFKIDMPSLTDQQHFQIFLQEQSSMVSVGNEGFAVAPGRHILVAVMPAEESEHFFQFAFCRKLLK